MSNHDEHTEINQRIDDLGESTEKGFKSVKASISRLRKDFKPVQAYFKQWMLDNQIDARIEAREQDKHIEKQINKGNISIPKEAFKLLSAIIGIVATLTGIILILVRFVGGS